MYFISSTSSSTRSLGVWNIRQPTGPAPTVSRPLLNSPPSTRHTGADDVAGVTGVLSGTALGTGVLLMLAASPSATVLPVLGLILLVLGLLGVVTAGVVACSEQAKSVSRNDESPQSKRVAKRRSDQNNGPLAALAVPRSRAQRIFI